jgi:hypothetical protein
LPYLSCPGCRFRLYRTAIAESKSCPACGVELVAHRGDRPDPSLSIFRDRRPGGGATVTEVLVLQRRIAGRVAEGASLAQVEREIIAPAALNGVRVAALRRYARTKLRMSGSSSPPFQEGEVC